MKEAPIHAGTIEQSHGAGVTVRKNRLRTATVGDVAEFGCDLVESLIPRNAGKVPRAFGTDAAHGKQQAVFVVLAIEVARHFPTEKAAGDGMRGVARDFCRAPIPSYLQHQRTSVGAIQGADRMTNRWSQRGVFDHCIIAARECPTLQSQRNCPAQKQSGVARNLHSVAFQGAE